MPLDKLVLIIFCVLAAAGATIWAVAALVVGVQMGPIVGLGILSLVALCAYICWRVVADRLTNKDDDHYDGFEN